MSNNVESLYSKKINMEQRIAQLNKKCEDISGLSISEKELIAAFLETLGKNLGLVKNGIKIGILKKIETMDLETLQSIAIRSLSIFSEGINPDTFISGYEALKENQQKELEAFEKGQQEELKKRKELVSSLEFEVEGPAYLFMDSAENLRTRLIFSEEDIELLKKRIKENLGYRVHFYDVKVPNDFFADDELLKLGPCYSGTGIDNNGFAVSCGDFLSVEELLAIMFHQLPHPAYIIRINNSMFRQFDGRYNLHAKPEENLQINQMGHIIPDIMEKQKLLSDASYLKKYIQELLVESEFLDWLSSIDVNNQTYQYLCQLKSLPVESFFSEEEFEIIINPILSKKAFENAQRLFPSRMAINEYKAYLNRAKKEIKAQIEGGFPKIYLKSSYLPQEERKKVIDSKIFERTFSSKDGISGLIENSNIITEEDLQALEQNQTITKEIDGRTISFGLDYGRIKGMSKYSDERKRQSNEFYEDLKTFIDTYRKAVNSYHSNQLLTIKQCDKQLEVLKELEQKLPRPMSYGLFKL